MLVPITSSTVLSTASLYVIQLKTFPFENTPQPTAGFDRNHFNQVAKLLFDGNC
jgi:hypothetical protein